MSEQPEKAIIDDLPPFTWSDRESVAYEAALEAINELIGAYTACIAAEEQKEDPNRQAVDDWRAARRGWAERQRGK
jgi:hypothetical protein